MTDEVRTIAMSDDLRNIILGPFNVPVPVEGQVIELISYAEFPVEIFNVRRKCGGGGQGSLGMVFEVDATDIVDWGDADSTGEIIAAEGALVESLTDGSSDFVAEGGSLRVTLQNLESTVVDLVFQVLVRRTQDNILVSE